MCAAPGLGWLLKRTRASPHPAGDNVDTATAIARECGILPPPGCSVDAWLASHSVAADVTRSGAGWFRCSPRTAHALSLAGLGAACMAPRGIAPPAIPSPHRLPHLRPRPCSIPLLNLFLQGHRGHRLCNHRLQVAHQPAGQRGQRELPGWQDKHLGGPLHLLFYQPSAPALWVSLFPLLLCGAGSQEVP